MSDEYDRGYQDAFDEAVSWFSRPMFEWPMSQITLLRSLRILQGWKECPHDHEYLAACDLCGGFGYVPPEAASLTQEPRT